MFLVYPQSYNSRSFSSKHTWNRREKKHVMSLPIYKNFPRNMEIRRWAVNRTVSQSKSTAAAAHRAPSFVMLIHSEKKEEVFSNIFRVGAKHRFGAQESYMLLKILTVDAYDAQSGRQTFPREVP